MAISQAPGYYVGYGSGAGGGFGYPGMTGFQKVPQVTVTPSPLRKTIGGNNGLGTDVGGATGGGGNTTLGTGQLGTGGGSNNQTTTTIMTPNQVYENEILGAPESVAAQGIFNAQATQLANARADAIQRAVINSGYTPQMSGQLASYAGDVTSGTLQQAASNPMSQAAQLNLQLQQANSNLPYDLAATGMGRSGAAAIAQGNLQRQYQSSQYQGMNDLLNSIYGSTNTYAQGYNNAQNQLQAAYAAAANRLQQAAGYSQSITTNTPGPNGESTDPLANQGAGGMNSDGTWTVPGYDVPPAPTSYGSYAGSPSYMSDPNTQAAVQRVINAIKQPAPRLGQTLRNVMAG